MRTRRIIILILALATAAISQSTIASHPILLRARPDIVLLLIVTYSVVRGVGEGLLGGLVGGFMVDMLSAVPFGTATLGMGLIGLLTGLGNANVYRANFIIPLVAVFLSTVFYHSFLMLALQADGRTVDWISTLALQTVPGAFLNAVLAPLAFYLVRRFSLPGEDEERFQW
jgi:rod shape-determining protein MreD